MDIHVNGRFLNQKITGVQRYGRAVLPTIEGNKKVWKPTLGGVFSQHFWEQRILLKKLKKAGEPLLINLCNSAPIAYKNQIVTIHDMAVFANPKWFHPVFRNYYQTIFRHLAKNSKHVVTVSQFSKTEIQKYLGVAPKNISVIYPPSPTQLKSVKASKPANFADGPFVLMVGSADPRKNFAWTIKQCQELLDQLGLRLVICGNKSSIFRDDGVEKLPLEVRFQADDSTLRWFYEHAELIVHPSLYEGFSLVPFEAAHFEKNILVSDIPVHREILRDRPYYFELGNPRSLLDQMKAALSSSAPKHATHPVQLKSETNWNELIRRFHNGSIDS